MDIKKEIQRLKDDGLYRQLNTLNLFESKDVLNFSSNDYLGLSTHPRVKSAAISAIETFGTSSSGSRLMCGNLSIHEHLEKELANFLEYNHSLVFGSGFLANVGAISALVGKGDHVFFDRLCHASLIDGVRLSEADWTRFKHNDVADLEKQLGKVQTEGLKLVIVESLYSMDGDIAPLRELESVVKKYDALLLVDEAHSFGVFGKQGRGLCHQLSVRPHLITGAFGKSMGSYGGFVACSSAMRELIINRARAFIFSTSLPPASISAVRAGLEVLLSEENLGKDLLERSKYFHDMMSKNFKLSEFSSHIIPILVGDNHKALHFAEKLLEHGVYAKAVRHPTVPKGTERLRLSVTLHHSKEQLEFVSAKMVSIAKELGLL